MSHKRQSYKTHIAENVFIQVDKVWVLDFRSRHVIHCPYKLCVRHSHSWRVIVNCADKYFSPTHLMERPLNDLWNVLHLRRLRRGDRSLRTEKTLRTAAKLGFVTIFAIDARSTKQVQPSAHCRIHSKCCLPTYVSNVFWHVQHTFIQSGQVLHYQHDHPQLVPYIHKTTHGVKQSIPKRTRCVGQAQFASDTNLFLDYHTHTLLQIAPLESRLIFSRTNLSRCTRPSSQDLCTLLWNSPSHYYLHPSSVNTRYKQRICAKIPPICCTFVSNLHNYIRPHYPITDMFLLIHCIVVH